MALWPTANFHIWKIVTITSTKKHTNNGSSTRFSILKILLLKSITIWSHNKKEKKKNWKNKYSLNLVVSSNLFMCYFYISCEVCSISLSTVSMSQRQFHRMKRSCNNNNNIVSNGHNARHFLFILNSMALKLLEGFKQIEFSFSCFQQFRVY